MFVSVYVCTINYIDSPLLPTPISVVLPPDHPCTHDDSRWCTAMLFSFQVDPWYTLQV